MRITRGFHSPPLCRRRVVPADLLRLVRGDLDDIELGGLPLLEHREREICGVEEARAEEQLPDFTVDRFPHLVTGRSRNRIPLDGYLQLVTGRKQAILFGECRRKLRCRDCSLLEKDLTETTTGPRLIEQRVGQLVLINAATTHQQLPERDSKRQPLSGCRPSQPWLDPQVETVLLGEGITKIDWRHPAPREQDLAEPPTAFSLLA